jgi:hypothetical protein
LSTVHVFPQNLKSDWKEAGYQRKTNEEQLQEFMEKVNSGRFESQKEMIEWMY